MRLKTIRPLAKVRFLGVPFLFSGVSWRTNLLRSEGSLYFGEEKSMNYVFYPSLKPDGHPKWLLIVLLVICLLAGGAIIARADETQIVAEVIAAEAADQDEIGLRAVACVIANRAKAQGVSPYVVVTARNQFFGYTAKNRHKLYLQVKPIADRLARDIMGLKDITGGALYFRRPDEKMFRWCKVETFRYKNHIFYR